MADTEYLKKIANVLRRDVIEMTTEAGSGHPTSCLSCAEIISSLFFSEMSYDVKNPYNPDNDEFVLSKGHAAPILYSALFRAGCIKENLLSLRKFSSNLQGHPIPSSIPWAKVATGSLGQGLSVGCGMALASTMQKRKFNVFVLLGDGEMSEGSNYEAMQFANYYSLNNLCAIVDVNRLGQSGQTMLGHNVETYKKRFESFGWDSEIVDGHNIEQINRALSKKSNRPKAIIAATIKGRGVSFLEDREGWHGRTLSLEESKKALSEIPHSIMPKTKIIPPIKINSQFSHSKKSEIDFRQFEKIATREAYGLVLSELASSDSRVLALDAEVSNSTFSNEVKKKSPHQFIENFIAEQNMIGVSLGLSIKGYRPFASTFAAFLTRAHDQIRMAALSSANMTICGSHCGVSIGEDGSSQMGLEDISLFRSVLDSKIFYPSDAVSTQKLMNLSLSQNGISYIRTTRAKTPAVYKKGETFSIADFKILRSSPRSKVVLVGSGITLHECLKAHEYLASKKIHSDVVDIFCIKPFNHKKFSNFVKNKKVVIAEDHYAEGGIAEMISSSCVFKKGQIISLAVRKMPHSATPSELLANHGIDARNIIKNSAHK